MDNPQSIRIVMRIPLMFFLLLFLFDLSGQNYTRGHYVDAGGERHEGAIAYQVGYDYFTFRENSSADPRRLRPEDVRSFAWGVETFASKAGHFVRVMVGEGPVRLYERRQPIDNPGKKQIVGEDQPGRMAMRRNFLLERFNTGEVIEVEWKRKKFIQQMSEFFADAPELVKRIEDKEFEPGDVEKLLKEYLDSYASQQ